MDKIQQNLFNQINANFENKLNYVENISSGSSNFVIKVKKDDVIYALRIPKPTDNDEDKNIIIESYKNISRLYGKLENVFPKIEKIEANVEPFYILYEYFSDNVFEYIVKKCEKCERKAFYNTKGQINGLFCKKHQQNKTHCLYLCLF